MKLSKQSGITLIALVTTVILLLILVSISLFLFGKNGLITRAKEAGEKWAIEQEKELTLLAQLEQDIEKLLIDIAVNPVKTKTTSIEVKVDSTETFVKYQFGIRKVSENRITNYETTNEQDYTFTNLNPDTEYYIEVKCINQIGTEIIRNISLKTIDNEAPVIEYADIKYLTKNSALLTMKAIDNDHDSLKYEVIIINNGNIEELKGVSENLEGQEVTIEITSLDPETLYGYYIKVSDKKTQTQTLTKELKTARLYIPIYTNEQMVQVAQGQTIEYIENDIKYRYIFTADESYILQNDLDLSSISWATITQFNGELDGNNYTLYNMSASLITTNNGIIKNLGIKDTSDSIIAERRFVTTNNGEIIGSYIEVYMGSIATTNNTTIDSCYNKSSIARSGIARTNSVTGIINNCYNTAQIGNIGTLFLGGISRDNKGIISNSYNTGSATATSSSSNLGGITCNNNGTIINCYNTGNISGGTNIGGIVGTNKVGVVENCNNQGTIIGMTVGGIAGLNDLGTAVNISRITHCYNTGDIIQSAVGVGYIAGISGGNGNGMSSNLYSVIENCYNKGNVSSQVNDSYVDRTYTAGISGYSGGHVLNCYNTGEISNPNANSAGIVGDSYNKGQGLVENCYNIGNVIGKGINATSSHAGGILGHGYGRMKNCYWYKANSLMTEMKNNEGVTTQSEFTYEEMKDQSTYLGFDFTNTWYMDEFPKLRNLPN